MAKREGEYLWPLGDIKASVNCSTIKLFRAVQVFKLEEAISNTSDLLTYTP